ncbi:cell division protein FtsL [Candidatus Palibaumannia cicadellinicola]|uniref:Cell division protein FtsL n=1 Tax=Candidatus Palibaumannia cicadellinicola TaxID=186490 RepID=A0A2N4XWH4_9GAMM|nr:cell division protein FtsL [Candidatus Baumannia cicadellinicola]PLK58365.1 cell division protein FtsL [Candidatus Baumannia cicadellinicola]
MISNEKYHLIKIISSDLLQNGKLSVILLIAVLLSAIMVITITHHTRRLTTEHENIGLENDILDIEWRNLILEENVLGDHSRIEFIAREILQMQHVDPLQEKFIILIN